MHVMCVLNMNPKHWFQNWLKIERLHLGLGSEAVNEGSGGCDRWGPTWLLWPQFSMASLCVRCPLLDYLEVQISLAV